jgi:hypothetical protein
LKFKDMLKDALEENSKRGNFLRIYPSKGTDVYDKFFKGVRPHNMFLYKWLYSDEILPMGYNESIREMPAPSVSHPSEITKETSNENSMISEYSQKVIKKQRPQTVKVGAKTSMKPSESDKIIITGDDVLIEYVHRLITSLSIVSEEILNPDIKLAIDKFILHYVWHSKDPAGEKAKASLAERLQIRYEEMRQRRKRLVKSIYKREGKLDIFEESYKRMAQQKFQVLKNFNGSKLEEMLKTSTKNVAQEVVSILINHSSDLKYGTLPDLERNYLKYYKTKPIQQRVSSANRSNANTTTTYIKKEIEAWAEDDDDNREEVNISAKHVLASSWSVSVNKFTNNQPPQIPPTVNYNNYFNNTKSRCNSKSRKNGVSSLATSQNDSKIALKTSNKRDSTSAQRRNNTIGNRRNSYKTNESDNVKITKPENKTTRHDIVDQK